VLSKVAVLNMVIKATSCEPDKEVSFPGRGREITGIFGRKSNGKLVSH
jgi:hypothetical protein